MSVELHVGWVAPTELAARPGYVHCTWHVDVGVVASSVDAWLGV